MKKCSIFILGPIKYLKWEGKKDILKIKFQIQNPNYMNQSTVNQANAIAQAQQEAQRARQGQVKILRFQILIYT